MKAKSARFDPMAKSAPSKAAAEAKGQDKDTAAAVAKGKGQDKDTAAAEAKGKGQDNEFALDDVEAYHAERNQQGQTVLVNKEGKKVNGCFVDPNGYLVLDHDEEYEEK